MLFGKLLSLSAALTLAHALPPTKVQRDFASINPTTSDLNDPLRRELVPRVPEPITNARRLAAGLPPLPPVRRSPEKVKGFRPEYNRGGPAYSSSGSRGSQPERNSGGPAHNPSGPKPSPKPDGTDIKRGYLMAYDADDNFQGYVSNIYNSFGEYTLDTDSTKALKVAINVAAKFSHIKALNLPNSTFPYVGGIPGIHSTDSNIGPSSNNYVYFGGVNISPKKSPAVNVGNSVGDTSELFSELSESTIWTYHQDGTITAQWINTDRSKPETMLVYVQQVLVLIGDLDTFQATYGPTLPITLKLSPSL